MTTLFNRPVRVSVAGRLPTTLIGTTGVKVTRASGAATIELDVNSLTSAASIADNTTMQLAAYDGSAASHRKVPVSLLLGALPDNAVTNAKLADMPTARIKGRTTAGTGDPEDLTRDQTRVVIGLPTSVTSGRMLRFTDAIGTIGQSLVEDNGSDAWLLPGGWAVRWQGGTGYFDNTGTEFRFRIGGGFTTIGVINATGWALGAVTAPEQVLHISVDGSVSAPALFQAHNASGSATSGITTRAARGTTSSPAATQSGDRPFGFFGQTFGGTTWASCVAVIGLAAETQSETARGAHLTFETTASGTTTRVERVRISQNGNVGIGVTSPAESLQTSGAIQPGVNGSGVSFVLGDGNAARGTGNFYWDAGFSDNAKGHRFRQGSGLAEWITIVGGVGINSTTPSLAGLDVNAPQALRFGSLALVNGANQNAALPAFSSIRITGPTGAFNIGGFTGGVDGRILRIFNTTSQAMTLNNEDAGSTAANRITTLTGANIVLRTGTSAATLIYDSTSSRWIVVGTN